MFHLESAIAAWRAKMRAAGIQSPAPLDELELHLREDVERLVRSGLSLEQAFASAREGIGTPETIQKEYGKLAWINSQTLTAFRPYALVISFILGTLFTSPEIISQILTVAMLLAAYEIEIRVIGWLEQRGEPPTRQMGIALALGSGLAALILQSSEIPFMAQLSRTTHQAGHVTVDHWSQPAWYTVTLLGLFLTGITLTILPKQLVRWGKP